MPIDLCKLWSLLAVLTVKMVRLILGSIQRCRILAGQRLFQFLTDAMALGARMACWRQDTFFIVLSPSLRAPRIRLEQGLRGMGSGECRVALPCKPLSLDVAIKDVQHIQMVQDLLSRAHDDGSQLANDDLEVVEVRVNHAVQKSAELLVSKFAHDVRLASAVTH
uniref:Expressed protein n=1 Tax=Schizophyllum commune (strain H4-8 / FGSC 9210) TaxID=578458 RepID=D8Q2V1_SCHCM